MGQEESEVVKDFDKLKKSFIDSIINDFSNYTL